MGVPREDWCKECLGKRMVGVGVMPGKDGSDADGSIASLMGEMTVAITDLVVTENATTTIHQCLVLAQNNCVPYAVR